MYILNSFLILAQLPEKVVGFFRITEFLNKNKRVMKDQVKLSVSGHKMEDCDLDQFLRAYNAKTLDKAIKAFVRFIQYGVENASVTGMLWVEVLIIVYNKKRIRRIAYGQIGYVNRFGKAGENICSHRKKRRDQKAWELRTMRKHRKYLDKLLAKKGLKVY